MFTPYTCHFDAAPDCRDLSPASGFSDLARAAKRALRSLRELKERLRGRVALA